MPEKTIFDYEGEISWCPGCGDYKILEALKGALVELGISPHNLVVVSGIGQAAKMPHYMKCHLFNGLHGRALPVATGIKASNPRMTVIAVGGDGDMYGEGGNHFMAAIRRNPNLLNLVCNNMIYGLTKGQASPTSPRGLVTTTTPRGVANEPMNPVAVALACGATFVARGFAGDVDQLKDLIKRAIVHKGYALVDVFQPCVSFNKTNTWQWFTANTYKLDADRDASDLAQAMALALEHEPYPLGLIYEKQGLPSFEETQAPWQSGKTEPLFMRPPKRDELKNFMEEMV